MSVLTPPPSRGQGAAATKTTVLLVEDNDEDAGLIARALVRFTGVEFVIERASSLTAARAWLKQGHYDAVLVDLALPDSDGLSTFTQLQALTGRAAVIVLTGNEREELGLRAVELGAQEYIIKSDRAWHTLPMSVAYACERVRRQEEVHELTSALAHAVDAIATIDEAGSCVAANGAFHALLGYAPHELDGTALLELFDFSERARMTECLASARDGELRELEMHALRKDNRILPVQLTLVARSGRRGHFCFVRDLTQRRKDDGRLAANAAITAVGSLANGLSHEINNPLAVVLANVEEAVRVVAEVQDGGAQTFGPEVDLVELRAMLEEAHVASQRVQFMVRDLRTFACADDRRARIDLDPLVESCCNIAFAEIRHRARLVKSLGAVVPVLGNESKLGQVVLHLLVNAAHAMPEANEGESEIRIETRQQGRGAIVLEVTDTGCGISPDDLPKIFDPFFTTRPRRPGLGLTIAQAAVAAHSGTITIGPRTGGGTVARVVLPTVEADLFDEVAARRTAAGPGAKEAPVQKRVLVVDDDPFVLRSLMRVLARDFVVSSARNGREALDMVRAGGAYDAMLCDLMMPELSGIELHEVLLHEDPELAKRTVFLTGGAFTGSARTFLETVGLPHLEKPVDLKTVRALLLGMSPLPPRDPGSTKWLVTP